jgi:hypothetical protein
MLEGLALICLVDYFAVISSWHVQMLNREPFSDRVEFKVH